MRKILVCSLLGISLFVTGLPSSARAEVSIISELVQLCTPFLEVQKRIGQLSSLVDDVLARQASCARLLEEIASCQPPAITPPPDAINLLNLAAREQQAGMQYYLNAVNHLSTPGSGGRLITFCPVLTEISNLWNLLERAENRLEEAAQYYSEAERMLVEFKADVCRGRSSGRRNQSGSSNPSVGE